MEYRHRSAERRGRHRDIDLTGNSGCRDPAHCQCAMGIAPFFNEGTAGAEVYLSILEAAPHATIVTKEFADGFEKTTLEETLTGVGATELLVCGMMTQNCVTHTAISKSAEKYEVSTRVQLVPFAQAL